MPDRSLIAIDVGTTFIKGAVVDPARPRLSHIRRIPFPGPLPSLPPLFHEVDPLQVAAAVRGLIEQLRAEAPGCAGVVMCGQMGGLVLTTERGRPLSNYISWRDRRLLGVAADGAGTTFDLLNDRLGATERRQLGNEIQIGNTLSLLFWLKEHQQPPDSNAIAANLPDFVLAHLCGAAPAEERTLATGALDLETLDWHWPVFAGLGLEVRWPALRDFREPVGRMDVGGASLPCYAPVGDHACALAGAFIGRQELSLNISTGSQASLLMPRLEPGDYQTRRFFDGQYLNTITHIPAGRSLNVLVGLLGELAAAQGLKLDDPWPYIEQAANEVTETDLAVDLAFFPSPAGERGAISSIREGNLTVGQLFFAAFRNMADTYRACALRLSPSQAWHTVVFSGGLAQKLELLRRMILARLERPYRLCATTEDTLAGLLALALVIDARAPSVEAATGILREQPTALIAEES